MNIPTNLADFDADALFSAFRSNEQFAQRYLAAWLKALTDAVSV